MVPNDFRKYRPDIDGLRAIAVLAVVAYHVFPKIVPGGFFGVDVFFVISGFLITGLINEDLKSSTFSIASFYSRRIRRIFPALILVSASVLAVGCVTLIPPSLAFLGKQIAAGAVFSSNVLLWHEAGYFDVNYISNPFLHLWSLGIEEQFYIVWPLVIYVFRKSRARMLSALLILTVCSFAYCLVIIKIRPEVAFLSPLSRFWELSAGGLVSLALPRLNTKVNKQSLIYDVTAALGLLAILFSYTIGSAGRSIPGVWSLLPVFGTIALIAVGEKALVGRSLLSLKALVWIGLISYPLYLWHWPLVSLHFLISDRTHSMLEGFALILISILLAWLTYACIEIPLKGRFRNRTKVSVYVSLMIFCGAAGLTVYARDGFPNRYSPAVARFLAPVDFGFSQGIRGGLCEIEDVSHPTPRKDFCVEQKRPLVFLWGDSHAAALYPALNSLQSHLDFGIAQMTTAGCPPIRSFGDDLTFETCARVNKQVLAEIKTWQPEYVILHSVWNYWSNGTVWTDLETDLGQTIEFVHVISPRSKVIVLGPVPVWPSGIPQAIVDWDNSNKTDLVLPNYLPNGMISFSQKLENQIEQITSTHDARFVSSLRILCPTAPGCLIKTGENPIDLTVVDSGHLSKAGAIYLVTKFGFNFR